MQDEQDLDYEAAVHLEVSFDEGFYPDWDGTDEQVDEIFKGLLSVPDEEDHRSEEEIVFDALTDAGLV